VRIRLVPTSSGKKAVQVVSKLHGKLTVHKHFGSYSGESEKLLLVKQAKDFILASSRQISLLELVDSPKLNDIEITNSQPLFVYRFLGNIYDKLGLNAFADPLIKDLVVARIFSPVSKLETLETLADSFNRRYSLKTVYRHLKSSLEKGVKEAFQAALINFAQTDLKDTLRLVFYDVTTLYFESVVKQGLRNFGFSKDHKNTTTQIVVGLVVNNQGFPLYFDIFNGSTFEGHTFLPIIKNIQTLLHNPELVIIADAAMLSQSNINNLVNRKIGFVVGARLANLPHELIDAISNQIGNQDGKIAVFEYKNQRLICQYSHSRAAKDKSDRLKQIEKAKLALKAPAKITSKFRFLKTDQADLTLNSKLISKVEKLEGIKGYLTNTQLPENIIIDRYHDLWHIENSFKITKSDLAARPIFHRLDDTIKTHLVIVFASLAITKYVEIYSKLSIKKVLKIAGKLLTHSVINTQTGENKLLETVIKDPNLIEKINLLKSLEH
jgi:transposase